MRRPLREREQRDDPGRTRIVARDVEILRFIIEAQPVRTSHIAGLFGMSFDVTRRRLRVLRDHGLVRVFAQALDEENEVVLAPAGKRYAEVQLGIDPSKLATPRGLGGFTREHHAMGVAFYVAVTNAIRSAPTVKVRHFAFEAELRRLTGNARGAQVPDAAFIIEGPGGRRGFAVEVDTGSERAAWVATRKALPYGELHRRGDPLLGERAWAVLFVVPDTKRVAGLARAFLEAAADVTLFFFATADDVASGKIMAGGWRAVEVDEANEEAKLVGRSPFEAVLTAHPDRDDGRAHARP